MSNTERVPVALDEALHWDLRQWMSLPGAPDTQREALDDAVAVWIEVDDPEAVLEASETLRDALETRQRVLHPRRYEQLQEAYREREESTREESGGQAPRPEEGTSHKPVHVSRESHNHLSEAAEKQDRSRKECLGEAVRLWTELRHWGETRDAREVLSEIRELVHPPNRPARERLDDDG